MEIRNGPQWDQPSQQWYETLDPSNIQAIGEVLQDPTMNTDAVRIYRELMLSIVSKLAIGWDLSEKDRKILELSMRIDPAGYLARTNSSNLNITGENIIALTSVSPEVFRKNLWVLSKGDLMSLSGNEEIKKYPVLIPHRDALIKSQTEAMLVGGFTIESESDRSFLLKQLPPADQQRLPAFEAEKPYIITRGADKQIITTPLNISKTPIDTLKALNKVSPPKTPQEAQALVQKSGMGKDTLTEWLRTFANSDDPTMRMFGRLVAMFFWVNLDTDTTEKWAEKRNLDKKGLYELRGMMFNGEKSGYTEASIFDRKWEKNEYKSDQKSKEYQKYLSDLSALGIKNIAYDASTKLYSCDDLGKHVKEYQKAQEVEETGVLDLKSLGDIQSKYDPNGERKKEEPKATEVPVLAAPAPVPAPAPAPTAPTESPESIKRKEMIALLEKLQWNGITYLDFFKPKGRAYLKELNSLLWVSWEKYSRETKQAIEKLQRENALKSGVDGKLGKNTINELIGALKAK